MSKDKNAVKKGIEAVFGNAQAFQRCAPKASGNVQIADESQMVEESSIAGNHKWGSKDDPLQVEPVPRKKGGGGHPRKIKVTYYIDANCVKSLKYLAVELDADYSSLVEEAVRDILRKYARRQAG
jgi:hypothetical protein